jgi:hypothetical protein
MNDDIESRPVWDAELANELVGKLLLVGLSYFEADGSFIEQQFYGLVQSAHPQNGILLNLDGQRSGETYTLPPDMRSIFVAQPGEYHLRASGETVTNPDFTVMFSIYRQPADDTL